MTRTHTPAGTAVTLTASLAPTRDRVEIAVADAGPGIASKDQQRLFERFWRADRARTRSRGGTGPGLAIVQSLVEAHGGRIRVESQPGRGSTFTVTLPASTPRAWLSDRDRDVSRSLPPLTGAAEP